MLDKHDANSLAILLLLIMQAYRERGGVSGHTEAHGQTHKHTHTGPNHSGGVRARHFCALKAIAPSGSEIKRGPGERNKNASLFLNP